MKKEYYQSVDDRKKLVSLAVAFEFFVFSNIDGVLCLYASHFCVNVSCVVK